MMPMTRREWLTRAGAGFGMMALADLLAREARTEPMAAVSNPMAARPPHFPARAKSIIFLFMYGGPSHVDLFDPKPALARWDGRTIPVYRREDVFMGRSTGAALRSPYRFRKHGRGGIDIADTFPRLARCADDLCMIRSMHCTSNNHGPALLQMQTGSTQAGHASMGSWVTYGLGSESENLPGFVVLMDHQGAPVNGALNWSNGFMPAAYQGVPFRAAGEPIAYLRPPRGTTLEQQRARLDLLARWNAEHAAANPTETALSARIAAYELAYRMQTHAIEAIDLASELESVRRLYGMDQPVSATFGRNCLLARRLVERGVRFVQVYSGGNNGPDAWDAHDDLKANHDLHCAETDGPIAGLLTDLKRRGLLDSTLVIWGGEFGRSPVAEARGGRDHHAKAFTMWLAGAGVKGGFVHGATDEFGYNIVENPVSIPDLHATCLHLLGLDHKRLTYPFQSRQARLTDVSGDVIEAVVS
jgi:hypothetical protein